MAVVSVSIRRRKIGCWRTPERGVTINCDRSLSRAAVGVGAACGLAEMLRCGICQATSGTDPSSL
jgi:hypothetical protein